MVAVGDEATDRSRPRGMRAWPSSSREDGLSTVEVDALRVWAGETGTPLPWSLIEPLATALAILTLCKLVGAPGVLEPEPGPGALLTDLDALRLLRVGN